MKYFILITTLLLNSLYADIKLIASPACKVNILSQNEVKQLFMLKTRTVEDEYIVVTDSSNTTTYIGFVKKYIKKSPKTMRSYWIIMLFTGRKIPPQKLSTEDLRNLETKDTCHITYVEVKERPEHWRVIDIK